MTVQKVGIIGAGQMGNGIAHVCALAGFDVVLNDIEERRIQAALDTIDTNLHRQVARGLVSEDAATKALGRIKTASSIDGLSDVDLAIEAATENEEVKSAIFRSICPVLKKDAYLASNTSSISITRLASTTDRPERFIGLHFMNPVPMMELVEVIRGIATEEEAYHMAQDFVNKLGKTITNAEDFPAFIVNR
ncbi:MAG: 3-hydroxybutyryl-CoA dehydrogenase, partial [Alphaproteobacteria bacterium]